jgi:carboxyl-terminal processing protease
MRTFRLLLPLCLLLAACSGDPSGPRERMSPEARAYLDAALDIMEENSIHRARIDWPELRERAVDHAGAAQTTAETYPAIRVAIRGLGDGHSLFTTPAQSGGGGGGGGQVPDADPPSGHSLPDGIAYVSMPGFAHPDRLRHVDEYDALLRKLDADGPCGWVVDLRRNTGGNMWPMLGGIGPVLGEGKVGAFVDPDGNATEWHYRPEGAGTVQPGAEFTLLARPTGGAYVLRRPWPPVAVLTGPLTGSSGEAIVTAFRGRPGARSFGRGTYGVSTANRAYRLSDGAMLHLTVSTFADRTGRLYGGVIEPDEPVSAPEITGYPETDTTVREAVRWLRAQPECAG